MSVCVGQIVGVHGVRGSVKIKPMLDDVALLADMEKMTTRSGQELIVHTHSVHGKVVLAKIKGVEDRTAAEKLIGTELFVSEDAFPELPEDEFYCRDLVGMTVLEGQKEVGIIKSIENYGAGDIVVIDTTDGRQEMIAFNDTNFPQIDLASRQVILNRPKIAGGTDAH